MPANSTLEPSGAALVERFIGAVEPAGALVATDFDGTLAPIVNEPGAARPLPGVLELLTRLTALVMAVAVISGRAEADLKRLLPVPGLRLLGDYGRRSATAAE